MIIAPITEGHLIKRYKRFLADIRLKDSHEIITAHCPNSGAMLGLLQENNAVVLSLSENPNRKYPYTLEAVQVDQTWVGVNTSLPNELVAVALQADTIPELTGYDHLKREVKYGFNSRIDFLLTAADKSPCYVEVKNVHLRRHEMAEFPDCVTARGTKHLTELTTLVNQGQRCVMIYVVQRDDCQGFQVAADLDPTYAKASVLAKQAGVETIVLTYSLKLQNGALTLGLNQPD
ncbi:DNA/RNA nuclease SfsA [Candidatus Finniella inopinata]|uniref:Sugar fermentation stimulation protein homolog n=1 Tax=Candidatus Finniella inopinata TaxID=1696036 RepID=A0A4Q7DNL5_9PROT|nr:DNA/RNA nuclease SfsA [Candidatus Finniella inopinata]RZI46486.1 DNA/RNA nuclease SfsA [Candidatus Finniella inopinata]